MQKCSLTLQLPDLIINSPLIGYYIFPFKLVTRIWCLIKLICLSIFITCLLDNVWIFQGEVRCQSLLGVNGLRFINSKKSLVKSKFIFV